MKSSLEWLSAPSDPQLIPLPLINLSRKLRQEVGWGGVKFPPAQKKWARFTIFLKRIRIPPHLVPLLRRGSRVSEYEAHLLFLSCKTNERTFIWICFKIIWSRGARGKIRVLGCGAC